MNKDEIIVALRASLSVPQRGYYWREVITNAIECIARLDRIENDIEAMDCYREAVYGRDGIDDIVEYENAVNRDDVLKIIRGES